MLAQNLKVLLASSYAFGLKAQNFHWNVEGLNFSEYHLFFENLYNEVNNNTIDRCAEFVRVLDEYSPGSFSRFQELSLIEDQTKIPRAMLMFEELDRDNTIILEHLRPTFESAQEEKHEGIANFIAEREDAHGKHGWMLKSFLKGNRV
jgi:starvation-inducible DNA-binding protein